MAENNPVRVLFVCMGNICRSPMAEAVFRHLVEEAGLEDRFEIASAGTGSWHAGQRPHPGTQAILKDHQVALHPEKRAMVLTAADLFYYDYVIAMDQENLDDMGRNPKVRRLLEFAPEGSRLDVPDPYYSGGFAEVYDLVTAGSQGLLAHIREKEGI